MKKLLLIVSYIVGVVLVALTYFLYQFLDNSFTVAFVGGLTTSYAISLITFFNYKNDLVSIGKDKEMNR